MSRRSARASRKRCSVEPSALNDDSKAESKDEVSLSESKRRMDVAQNPFCLNPDEIKIRLEMINKGFYLNCPDDFIKFYEFCRSANPNSPLEPYIDLEFKLVGPFEIFHAGFNEKFEEGEWVNHYRFFHDPPEFVTVIITKESHIGYFRDSPDSEKPFVALSSHALTGTISYLGSNLFVAIKTMFEKDKSSASRSLLRSLSNFAETHNIMLKNLSKSSLDLKDRKKNTVCATLNGIGLVIKTHLNDVGYRPLPVSYKQLCLDLEAIVNANSPETQASNFDSLDGLITCVQFANDEGDFGEGLELGLSLLAFHPKAQPLNKANIFNGRIKHLLSIGYELGGKPKFSHVIKCHMKNRCIEPLCFK